MPLYSNGPSAADFAAVLNTINTLAVITDGTNFGGTIGIAGGSGAPLGFTVNVGSDAFSMQPWVAGTPYNVDAWVTHNGSLYQNQSGAVINTGTFVESSWVWIPTIGKIPVYNSQRMTTTGSSFTVPAITWLYATVVGGGGGGGSGANTGTTAPSATTGGAGGAGGAGVRRQMPVTLGDTITFTYTTAGSPVPGAGGLAPVSAAAGIDGNNGTTGSFSTLTNGTWTLGAAGGSGGLGATHNSNSSVGGGLAGVGIFSTNAASGLGGGGAGANVPHPGASGETGGSGGGGGGTTTAAIGSTGGSAGSDAGGGAAGTTKSSGSTGGAGGSAVANSGCGGGGGGSSAGSSSAAAGAGGSGANGYVLLEWWV